MTNGLARKKNKNAGNNDFTHVASLHKNSAALCSLREKKSPLQLNAERSAATHLRCLHEDSAVVVFLDDALGKREAEAPATLLRGEARLEDTLQVLLANALARVAHLYHHQVHLHAEEERDATRTFHRVDGILAKVLDDPFEERGVKGYDDGLRWQQFLYMHLVAHATRPCAILPPGAATSGSRSTAGPLSDAVWWAGWARGVWW